MKGLSCRYFLNAGFNSDFSIEYHILENEKHYFKIERKVMHVRCLPSKNELSLLQNPNASSAYHSISCWTLTPGSCRAGPSWHALSPRPRRLRPAARAGPSGTASVRARTAAVKDAWKKNECSLRKVNVLWNFCQMLKWFANCCQTCEVLPKFWRAPSRQYRKKPIWGRNIHYPALFFNL